jgi:hypothetical protein
VGRFSGRPRLIRQIRQTLASRAFLYDNPSDYLAGVEEAMRAMTGADGRVLVVDDRGREEWLQTLEQYRVAWGPPRSSRARDFESKLERQLLA